jgi:hypothetical protein
LKRETRCGFGQTLLLLALGFGCLLLAGCEASGPATPQINWPTPAPITFGAPLTSAQLNAKASVAGTYVYTPALGTVLPPGSQTLSVTFTPTDTTRYTTAIDSVTLAVDQINPVISWATPAPVTYGTALSGTQLDATANVPGTFAYSPPAGAIPLTGSTTLSVTFTPANAVDYATVSASVTITVNQATPQIVWAPVPIAVGMAVGPGQQDAIAVPQVGGPLVTGTFVYSPPTGTVFNASGPQSFTVSFTPFDTLDYTSINASIIVNIVPFGVVAWGDSLTSGNDGNVDFGNYPSELQPLLLLPVVNEGIRGNTSTQIGVREGGVPTYATVAGGIIPASGGVSVSFPVGYEPVTVKGPVGGTSGTILGVHGLVTLNSNSGVYTFTRTNEGSAVNAGGSPQFVVDTPYAIYLPVFWEGRDNYVYTQQIKSDLGAQVATVPSGQDYLVMSIINVNLQNEWKGGPSYNIIVDFNEQLAAIYGSHYLDIRKVLVDSYNPALVTDVSDYQHDEVPTSLRAIGFDNGTLENSVGPGDTTITVNNTVASQYGANATVLTIDTGPNAENVQVTGIIGSTSTGTTLTVQRNFGGNDTSHAAGVPVVGTDYTHLDAQGYQVVADAVAQYLSAYKVQQQKSHHAN